MRVLPLKLEFLLHVKQNETKQRELAISVFPYVRMGNICIFATIGNTYMRKKTSGQRTVIFRLHINKTD